MKTTRQMQRDVADEQAGARMITCAPVRECPNCGGHQTETTDGANWKSCVKCGTWEDDFVLVVPEVLGAAPGPRLE